MTLLVCPLLLLSVSVSGLVLVLLISCLLVVARLGALALRLVRRQRVRLSVSPLLLLVLVSSAMVLVLFLIVSLSPGMVLLVWFPPLALPVLALLNFPHSSEAAVLLALIERPSLLGLMVERLALLAPLGLIVTPLVVVRRLVCVLSWHNRSATPLACAYYSAGGNPIVTHCLAVPERSAVLEPTVSGSRQSVPAQPAVSARPFRPSLGGLGRGQRGTLRRQLYGPLVGIEIDEPAVRERRELAVVEPSLHAALDVFRDRWARRIGELLDDVSRRRRDGRRALPLGEELQQIPAVGVRQELRDVVTGRSADSVGRECEHVGHCNRSGPTRLSRVSKQIGRLIDRSRILRREFGPSAVLWPFLSRNGPGL